MMYKAFLFMESLPKLSCFLQICSTAYFIAARTFELLIP